MATKSQNLLCEINFFPFYSTFIILQIFSLVFRCTLCTAEPRNADLSERSLLSTLESSYEDQLIDHSDHVTNLPMTSHDWKDNFTHSPDHNVTEPFEIIVSSCIAFINYYGQVAANFTECAVQHARPFQFCQQCVEPYIMAHEVYHEIMKVYAALSSLLLPDSTYAKINVVLLVI